ncbi:MAG: Gfo/Idh/MocA family oxidoreductase [Gorillibacterium sp.]|nr:Gfo/Idh/MocA family oxidoreductase [Gorillibacterium sp.]
MSYLRKWKIAVIGLGDIAQKAYLPVISRHADIDIVSVMSRRGEIVNQVREEYRFPSGCTDLTTLLRAEPDAVFVHAPTEAHFDIVQECLRQGLHVYVDKPLSYDIKESEAMVEAAERSGKLLAVGFNRRFAPFYLEAKAWLALAGGPEYILAEKHRIRLQKHDAKRTLYDDLIHMIDLLLWLGGPVAALNGWKIRVDGEGRLLHAGGGLEFTEASAHFAMNRASGADLERLTLHGSGRSAEVVNLERGILASRTEGEKSLAFSSWDSVLYRRGFVGVIDHFLKNLDHPESCEIRADQVMPTHHLIEQLLR